MFGFSKSKRTKPLVMHVDDDNDILNFLRDILVSMDLDVVSSTNGIDALKLARGNPPDLVILDIRMPGMDGFDVCWQLKKDPKTGHIPVLMMTAMGQMKDVEKAIAHGSDDYVVKPVDFPAFKSKVLRLLKLTPPNAPG